MAGYTPGEQPRPGDTVIKLNTNENPYPPSPNVFEAIRKIGGDALRIAEAVRRRRVDHQVDDLYTERLLGLRLTHHQVQRGKNFIAGVVDRVGEARLSALLARPKALPTAAEIDAPGLWVARLELVDE